MKKFFTVFFICLIMMLSVAVSAQEGKVIYNGNAKQFIFQPGGEYSLTDLFPEFKDVMPGDTLTQKITVRNDASNKVKVKIYIRSLGAQTESAEFLSKLNLKVSKSTENKMAYMFDSAANEAAQLTDWVYLGTLYSGGTVNLDVTLNVPVELDNEFQNKIGYLDWEFMVEEMPVDPSDPKPTGDNPNYAVWFIIFVAILLLLVLLKKRRNEEKE